MDLIVNYTDNKIIIDSYEENANKLRTSLMLDSDFWIDIRREFKFISRLNKTLVRTIIDCKGVANPQKMFELKSVKDSFLNFDKISFHYMG